MNGTLLVWIAIVFMVGGITASILAVIFGWKHVDAIGLCVFAIGAVLLGSGIYLGGWPGFDESFRNALGSNWPMMGW